MCTAIRFSGRDFYLARTLDTELDYHEEITLARRGFDYGGGLKGKYAVLGMARTSGGCPMFFDGVNECGLGMAALAFVGFARYERSEGSQFEIPPHLFIPYILSTCKNLEEAKTAAKNCVIADVSAEGYSSPAPLHFIVASKDGALIIESTDGGIAVYENAGDVLTNSPPYPWQTENLKVYCRLTSDEIDSGKCCGYIGCGGIGLPGDYTSQSRFIRGSFLSSSVSPLNGSEEECLSDIFGIMGGVSVPKGAVRLKGGPHYTRYISVINLNTGVYFVKRSPVSCLASVSLEIENLDGGDKAIFPHKGEISLSLLNKKTLS